MNAAIIWDEAYAEHATGAHPEGADRISATVDHLRATDLWPVLTVVRPETATEDDILDRLRLPYKVFGHDTSMILALEYARKVDAMPARVACLAGSRTWMHRSQLRPSR